MFCFHCTAEAPRITSHPQELKDAVPGRSVTLTIQATGTQPLMYQWQWTPAGDGKEEWQHCNMERSDGASLSFVSVQKSDEGIYHCIVSNLAGKQTSKSAKLSVGKNPDINTVVSTITAACCFLFLHS